MSTSERRSLPAAAGRTPTTRLASEDFARRLRTLMANKGWSQADLAKAVWGTVEETRGDKTYTVARNRDRISVYLKGGTIPDNKNLAALAEALEVDVGELAPQLLGDAVERDDPGFQTTVVRGHPHLTHLRISAVVPMSLAMRVGLLMEPFLGSPERVRQSRDDVQSKWAEAMEGVEVFGPARTAEGARDDPDESETPDPPDAEGGGGPFESQPANSGTPQKKRRAAKHAR